MPPSYPIGSPLQLRPTFIDDNDPEGVTAAHVEAKEKYLDSFETIPFVNSRERRQIIGEYEVAPLDSLAGRTFEDTMFTARNNFDTNGFIVHPVFMVTPPDHSPLQAHVPLRCMIPKAVGKVIVTGLGMSAHRDAFPVIRMQADVQNQGYAVGLLAAQAAASGQLLREVDAKASQKRLVEVGILAAETANEHESFPLASDLISNAAAGNLDNAKDVAILFAHPEEARRTLLPLVCEGIEGGRKARAALILGLMGCAEAGPALHKKLEGASWDDGWNFRGMGQFGLA